MKKAGLIIGWIAAILIVALNVFAIYGKFAPVVPGSAAEAMNTQLGLNGLHMGLAIVEIIVTLLFIIPRTSTVGTVLMAGYMGGVLATMLTHGISNADSMPIYIALALVAVSGWFRNPELKTRLLGRPVVA